MSVRLEDINPGDEVTVQRKVDRVVDDGIWVEATCRHSSHGIAYIPNIYILSHTPALEPGDVVRFKDNHQSTPITVAAVRGAYVWLEWPDGHMATEDKSAVTLVRKASPP